MFYSLSPILQYKGQPFQLFFQEPSSSLMLGIADLHHTIFFYLIVIFNLVAWLLFILLRNADSTPTHKVNFAHCSLLEIVWTVLPSCIIAAILFPSLSMLHAVDELIDPVVTLKVIGHQWSWSYEFSDYRHPDMNNSLAFDSNLNLETKHDLLEVDNPVVLPVHTSIRFLITSDDVLHSWAIPALGIKMDACPGRLNQVMVDIYRPGFFYGQCSELCGVGHGFMPIKICALPMAKYMDWVVLQHLDDTALSLPTSYSGILEFLYYLQKLTQGTDYGHDQPLLAAAQLHTHSQFLDVAMLKVGLLHDAASAKELAC